MRGSFSLQIQLGRERGRDREEWNGSIGGEALDSLSPFDLFGDMSGQAGFSLDRFQVFSPLVEEDGLWPLLFSSC